MAKLNGFSLLEGFSGKLGNQLVIRRSGNRTILTAKPKKREKPPTEKQLAIQRRFRLAAAYAKTVMNDPVLRSKYPAGPKNKVFGIMMASFLKNRDHDEPDDIESSIDPDQEWSKTKSKIVNRKSKILLTKIFS